MLTAEYERNLSQNTLVLFNDGGSGGKDERYQEEMLIRNKIEGLLPACRRIFNNQIQYCYEISGFQSLRSITEHDNMDKGEIWELFHALFDCIRKMAVYLLDDSGILLSPEYIFVCLPSYQIKFCYFPGYQESSKLQLNRLMEYLMNHINYKDQKTIVLLYNLYMKNKDEKSELLDLERLLQETDLDNEKSPKESEKIEQEINFVLDKENDEKICSTENQCDIKHKMFNLPILKYIIAGAMCLVSILTAAAAVHSGLILDSYGNNIDQVKLIVLIILIFAFNFGTIKLIFHINGSNCFPNVLKRIQKIFNNKTEENNSNYLDAALNKPIIQRGRFTEKAEPDFFPKKDELYGETVVLYDPEEIQDKTAADINIEKDYAILKMIPEQTELYETIIITELPFYIGKLKTRTNFSLSNPAVSRIHSKLVEEAGKLFLYDMNSTNGTFINGTRLPVNQGKEIQTGDFVGFADAVFRIEMARERKTCLESDDMVQSERRKFFIQ